MIQNDLAFIEDIQYLQAILASAMHLILDAQTDFMLTATITNSKKIGEVELAMQHLDNLNQRIDMTNTITTYDRGYDALKLILKHKSINSYFLIRLKADDFKNEQKYMKTNDETIDLTINRTRTLNFHDEELMKQAREKRITEIELTTKT